MRPLSQEDRGEATSSELVKPSSEVSTQDPSFVLVWLISSLECTFDSAPSMSWFVSRPGVSNASFEDSSISGATTASFSV